MPAYAPSAALRSETAEPPADEQSAEQAAEGEGG